MNCSIKDTKASEFLKVSSKKMEPGYFDTPKFIKQFGEWRPSKLSEAQIAENSKNALRFNDDGSPRLDVNDYGVVFFVDKSNNKIPIIEEMFKTLPLEIRSETSNEIMDALVSDLVLSYLNKNEEFLAGEKVQNFALDKYLDAKIKQFKDEGRLSKIAKVSLEESMPDYLEGIKHKLYRLGIKVQNDAVKELQSIERPTTDKASPTIKAVMQFVPKVGGDGERIDSKLIIDQPTFMSPSEVWGVMLAHFADMPMQKDTNMIDVYLKRLEELTITHPWAVEILDTIQEGSVELKVQFVVAMNNIKNDVYITEQIDGKFTTKSAAGATTSKGQVIKEWAGIIEDTMLQKTQEERKAVGLTLRTKIITALEELEVPENDSEVGASLIEVHKVIAPMFEAIGVPLEEHITIGAFGSFTNKIYKNADSITDIDYLDLYKRFITDLQEKVLPSIGRLVQDRTHDAVVGFRNNIDDFGQSIVNVENDSGVHMVTVGKNRVYIYSLPSVLQETINEWKNNPEIVQDMANNPLYKGSRLIQHWSNPNNLAQVVVGMRGVVTTKRQSGRRDSKDGKEISKGDYAKVDFYNVMRTINGKVSPIYNTQVPADKGKEFQLNIPEFFTETGSNEDAAKLFVGYVQNELNHMLQAEELISDLIGKELKELPSGAVRASFEDMQDGITYAKHISNLVIRQNELNDEDRHNLMSLIENVSNHLTVVYHLKGDTFINLKTGKYHGRAFEFTTVNELNNINALIDPISGLPTIRNSRDLELDTALNKKIVRLIEDAVSKKVEKFTKKAQEEYGIKVVNNHITNVDLDVVKKYKGAESNIEIAYANLIRDFVTNYMISKIEYAHLFTGLPSFYKSNSDYIKRVPATYIDGLQPVTGIEEGDGTFTQMTFATESFKSPLADINNPDLSPSIKRYYTNVDRTDAQGFITPKRWRQILLSVGKLGPSNKKIYDKIIRQGEAVKAGKPIAEEDKLTLAEIKNLSAQPLKGVYFKNELGVGPTYLKYSQAVLLPQFVENNPRARQLLAYMEEHGIDEMVAQTGVKVGAKKPTPLFDGDNFIATTLPVISTLDARNYRIQQDLPTKTIKPTKIGIQVQKMIMSGLAFSGDTKLLQDIENALADLSNRGIRDYLKKYGIAKDGTYKITDISKFYKSLLSDILDKEVPEDNVVRALKSEVPISLLPSLKSKLQNKIFGGVRKAATHLLTPGGGFVQISDFLIGKTDLKRGGIKMLVELDRLQPPKIVNNSIRPGQVLVPHSMIYKLLPNYMELSTEDLNKKLGEGVKEIIGYRIPTQAKASVDLLEIVGILPPEMGDSIIAYGEITAKTGSDFDIDKMYLMIREMEMTEDGRIIASPTRKTVEYKTQETYMKDVVTEVEEELPIAGIMGVNKPEVNIEFLTNKELVDLDDAKSIIAHRKLQEDAKDLEDLINCIWA